MRRFRSQVGVYQGALTYQYGVYRPTDQSIMRHNIGGYNAPSREAIYKRIMKLSESDSWEYDYETFVAYDAVNRSNASQTYMTTRSATSTNAPSSRSPHRSLLTARPLRSADEGRGTQLIEYERESTMLWF